MLKYSNYTTEQKREYHRVKQREYKTRYPERVKQKHQNQQKKHAGQTKGRRQQHTTRKKRRKIKFLEHA